MGAPQGPRLVVYPPQTRPLSLRAQMARPGNMGTVAPAPTSENGSQGLDGEPPRFPVPTGPGAEGWAPERR